MSLEINFRSNLAEIERKLDSFAYKQVPFASAQALTAIARLVVEKEVANETKVLDRPKPFTTGALFVIGSTKQSQEARVIMKDRTAEYLEPYEFGGTNVLTGKKIALLKPVDAKTDLDQYGNLPKSFLRTLKQRSDIFVGPVKTRTGVVNGVWQRATEEGGSVIRKRITKSGRLVTSVTRKRLNTMHGLRLLIKFQDAHPVKQHLDWFGVASATVSKAFEREFGRALAKAIATAK